MTATTQQLAPRPPLGSRTFASLAEPNYLWYFLGALVSNTGTWMMRTCQDWLVLTDLTDHSSTALGTVSALQFLAIPFLAPYAGAVADRFPKRKVLLATQTLLALTSAWLWLLVARQTVELWQVYVFALLQGVITAFDMPARQAFVSEMVDDDLIPNAVGLNSMSFNAARLIGPGVAGLLIAGFGVAPGMLINTLSFVAMLVALLAMDPGRLHPAPPAKGRGSAREGLAYIAHRPDIIIILVMIFMLGTFGMNFPIYNATMTTEVFGRGASEYGALGTIMAIGTFGAAVIAARRRHPRLATLLVALVGFTVFNTLLALAPSYLAYAVWLVPTGLCMLTVMTCANSAVQMTTDPSMRGRVMAVYAAIMMGGTPIGAPIVGWVGDVAGPRWSILLSSILLGLTCIGVVVFMRFHERMRVRLERGRPPRLRIWRETDESDAPELPR